jgi:hypothetical protein
LLATTYFPVRSEMPETKKPTVLIDLAAAICGFDVHRR